MPTPSRELAAILFADIVGYTTAMQANEDNALLMVRNYQQVLNTAAAAYNGKVFKNYGDGSLLVFPNSVNAVLAARQIQLACIQDVSIPLRIGIHVGEFIIRDGDIYGNGVNLASRIESLGVPGAILVSGEVQRKVKNRPNIDLSSLGSFHFKNVEEPVELYALQGDSLITPQRNQIEGKLRQPKRRNLTGIMALTGVILVAAIAWIVLGQQRSEPLISEENRDRNIAVSAFDNQTNDPALDAFGNMISDWTTNGLKEVGRANVINLANVPDTAIANNLKRLNSGTAKSVGVDLFLTGRYYLTEARLTIAGDIVNAQTGSTIESFSVTGPRTPVSDLLMRFSNQVQAYWAIRDQDRFLANPPKYEAYQSWRSAQPIKQSDPEKAQELLREAFESDTNFIAPLFDLYAFAQNESKTEDKTALFNILGSKSHRFTKWESISFETIKALNERRYLKAAQLSERRFALDQSDYAANSNAAVLYGWVNYPEKALEVLEQYDERLLGEDVRVLSWRETFKAFPYYQMQQYEKIGPIAKGYSYPRMSDALAVMHLKSLVRMDSLEAVRVQFDEYARDGVYSSFGSLTPEDEILALVCDELFCTRQYAEIPYYTNKLRNHVSQNPDTTNRKKNLGLAAFYEQDYTSAARHWMGEATSSSNLPGWMQTSAQLAYQGRLGHVFALSGDTVQAKRILDRHFADRPDDEETLASQQYYAARILCGLGLLDEAVASLDAAVKNGFSFFRPAVFQQDPFLEPLFEHSGFIELIRPGG